MINMDGTAVAMTPPARVRRHDGEPADSSRETTSNPQPLTTRPSPSRSPP